MLCLLLWLPGPGIPAWDMRDIAASEFTPVVFCLHMLCIMSGYVTGEHTGVPAAVHLALSTNSKAAQSFNEYSR